MQLVVYTEIITLPVKHKSNQGSQDPRGNQKNMIQEHRPDIEIRDTHKKKDMK